MNWYVYVLKSLSFYPGKKYGPTYVGCTNDPVRRLKQHNGFLVGGGKYTAKHRPWEMCALFSPYLNRSEALKAEWALKHGKRGQSRIRWSLADSPWCRGLGMYDPQITVINAACGLVPTLVEASCPIPIGVPDGIPNLDEPR